MLLLHVLLFSNRKLLHWEHLLHGSFCWWDRMEASGLRVLCSCYSGDSNYTA